MQDAPGQHQEGARKPVAATGCDPPASHLLVPFGPGDVGLEEGVGVEVERAGQEPGILEDLRGAGIALGRHEPGLLEERKVRVRLHIAHTARVSIPVPGATEVSRLLDDPEIGDPVLAQVDRREHPGEAATHDHDCRLLDHRVSSEAGLYEWVPVEVLELVRQLTPLGHTFRRRRFCCSSRYRWRSWSIEGSSALLSCSIALPFPGRRYLPTRSVLRR